MEGGYVLYSYEIISYTVNFRIIWYKKIRNENKVMEE